MTNATTSNSSIYKEDISYDKNGNIGYLSRNDILSHGWAADGITPAHTYGSIDYLGYSYNGNQLSHVVEYNSVNPMYTGSQDFKNNTNASSYTYDSNGNMTSNLDKNIPTIKYNYLNLPDTVQMLNGDLTTFYYDAITGAKTCVNNRTYTGAAETMPVGSTLFTYGPKTYTTTSIFYYDNVIYENSYIKKLLTTDDMLKNTVSSNTSPVFKRYYNIKDHLGNVCVVFDENGVVNQVNNYYPFGMEYGESAQDQTELAFQDYEFGGKEFNRKFEVNMYDFGARNYDATVGRWTTMDPFAEKYYSTSPYVYCVNNPVRFLDPDGRGVVDDLFKGLVALKQEVKQEVQNVVKQAKAEIKQTIKKVNAVAEKTIGIPLISKTSTTSTTTTNNILKTKLGDKISTSHSVSKTIGKSNGLINLDIANNTTDGESTATVSTSSGSSLSVSANGMIGAGVTIGNTEAHFSKGLGVGLGEGSVGTTQTNNGISDSHDLNVRPGGGCLIGGLIIAATLLESSCVAAFTAAAASF